MELILVEDNSKDNTRKIARELKNKYNIKILEREGKMGLGSAYMDGFKLATGDFLIIMDADLSHHPKYIPKMIKKMSETNADIVLGSRYINGGGIYGWNLVRKFTSRVANFITTEALSVECSDFTNSFRLYKKSKFDELVKSVENKGFGF